ncbi:glycosyl hydrolase family 28-related protein [Methylorubrum aminovorans]
MKRFSAAVAALLALFVAAPALAQTKALPPGEIRANGDITFGNALKLGKREGNKTVITPDTLQILGPGSTGDASAMSAAAPGAAAARTLADLVGFAAGNTPTIATLRALPTAPLVGNLTVSVAGYYAAADGGGGTFAWSPTSTAADDGVVTIKPTAVSGAGRWQRVLAGPLSIRMAGARGDGVADDGPSIRAAYVAAAALGNRDLTCPSGTYRIASTINMTNGVVVSGGRDCVIKAANNGPTTLFEVGDKGNGVDGVGFRGVKFDGNRSNNPLGSQVIIHLRFALNSFVRDCEFVEGASIGAAGYGDNQDFSGNIFRNFRDLGIVFYGFNNPSKNLTIKNNQFYGAMGHAANASFVDGFDFSGNYAKGTVVGQRNGLAVNVSGNTVTYAAGGTNFASILPGQFLVLGGGGEWLITGKTNDNVITVEPNVNGNPPQGNSRGAMVGSGDFFGLDAMRNGTFANNTMIDAATYGMGLGATSVIDTYGVSLTGNTVLRVGKYGINVDGGGVGRKTTNVSIVGNTLVDAGVGADQVDPSERNAIVLTKNQGALDKIFIAGNAASSDTVAYGPTLNWLYLMPNLDPGTVFLGRNTSTTQLGNQIANDVKSISLTGWGTGATTDSISSTGTQVSFRVVGKSGITAVPKGVVSKVTDSGSNPVVTGSIFSAAGGNVDTRYPIFTGGSGKGLWTFAFQQPTAPGADTILVLSLTSN